MFIFTQFLEKSWIMDKQSVSVVKLNIICLCIRAEDVMETCGSL